MTNMDSSRHITGGNMSDRRLTNRTTSSEVIAAANSANNVAINDTVTPRSRAILNASTGSGRPATTASGNKVPFSSQPVPALDLSKTGPATGGVRTGGLAAY